MSINQTRHKKSVIILMAVPDKLVSKSLIQNRTLLSSAIPNAFNAHLKTMYVTFIGTKFAFTLLYLIYR